MNAPINTTKSAVAQAKMPNAQNRSERRSKMSLFSYPTLADATFWYVVSWRGLLIAGVLTAVGAIATTAFLVIQFTSSAARDGFSDQRISANEAATAQAQVDLAKSNERIAELTTQGDEARAQIALANKAAAEAAQKAEEERLARVKLEAQLAPRSLNDAGMAILTREVASLKGTQVDIVSYESMGADVPSLAMQIEEALDDAGLDAAVFTPFGGQGYVRGVLVRTEVGSSDFLTTGVATLIKAITDAGVAADSWTAYPVGEKIAGSYNGPTGRQPVAKIRILVGSKP